MSKHTPGPWSIDETYGLIMAGKTVEVAACHAGRGADAKANARLIAAAPEMLEALRLVSTLVSGEAFHDEAQRLAVWERVDAAIAEASGRK